MSRKLVLLAATALSAAVIVAPAFAQDAAPQTDAPAAASPDESQVVIVRGIRRSMKAAIDIKKAAINTVDSIAAEDLGKLPDQNVAESLQRIPGVTIERNRGEGRYVSVRGFGPKFNAVTVNGRTLATDNNGREFSFDVLPSELIAGADVYKSPQANINGASIGATVDVRTLRPLDQSKSFTAAGSIGSQWAELADTQNPEASGVMSWRNDARTFGVALSASYMDQEVRDDEFTIGAGHVYRSSTDSYYNAGGVAGARIGPDVAPFTHISMPSNLSPFFFVRKKKMTGLNGSLQWKPAENLTLTLDTLYSKADITEDQTGLAYDFSGGTLVEQVVQGNEAVYQRYTGGTVDQILQHDTRDVTTTMVGFNAAWKATDTLTLSFDASTSKAQRRGKEDSDFTTIRRKNMDLWFDRRSGSPIYDYGFSSPNYDNASTNPQGITAHYYIWGGGSDIDDKTNEFKLDAKWAPEGAVTLYAGLASEQRTKTITTNSMPFGQQCAYCGSDRVLPESLFSNTNMNFFSSHSGNIIRDWVAYDPIALINQVKQFADADGKAFAPGVFDPSGSSVVDEKVTIGYLMSDIRTEIGGMPLSINAGVRVEDTNYTSSGASRTVLSAVPNGAGQNIITVSDVVPVSFDGHYTDILPSLNAKLNLTDELIARFSASRVLTRPTLSDLSPKQSIQTNPGNETIKRGNPDLQPFRASQIEGGLEWYFDRTSLLSFNAFYKNIDSFVTLTTTPQKVDQVTFQVTVPTNGNGAVVKGFELGYRQVFSDLPSPFDGLGAQVSYTYAESDANYVNAVANVSYGLEGLSKDSYTLVGFYEKYGFQARLAYTWRDKFLQVASGRNGEPEYFDAYGQLDAGVSYDINDHFTVYLDGLNLTDENEFIYSVTPDRTKEYRTTGKRISAGIRFRY
ncbi:TonB-dependent receptor [Asticcacaulis taihuensis]|uniref:TonB-dependent receptor n=1 Tax=Asticcacaulis taihuensis TaxID=260084 RepID=A0A1G4S094_9CAUL|nr:TonB-dependent receptor [Asticcacaulis taihuensis]SCW62135.1 TonB-dependent receptor [Asticcacaulis taihuensis]